MTAIDEYRIKEDELASKVSIAKNVYDYAKTEYIEHCRRLKIEYTTLGSRVFLDGEEING